MKRVVKLMALTVAILAMTLSTAHAEIRLGLDPSVIREED